MAKLVILFDFYKPISLGIALKAYFFGICKSICTFVSHFQPYNQKMKNSISILLYCFIFSLQLNGQKIQRSIIKKEFEIIDSVSLKYDNSNPNIQVFKSLKDSYNFTSCEGIGYLDVRIGYEYSRQFLEAEKNNFIPELCKFLLDSTLYYFDLAINDCNECSGRYRKEKLDFLIMMKDKSMYKKEVDLLKKIGYKQERNGFSFGISSQFGKNNWLGINLAIYESYHPNNTRFFKSLDFTGKISYLNFEVQKNLNQNQTDVSISLIKLSAPIYIDITKFGYLNLNKTNEYYGYYRPEIGLSWNIFSAGYAYNLVFKKDKRDEFEKHLFFVRLSYPFLKYND